MTKTIIKCAIHRITGEAIHIDKADNGLDCGCYCTVCDKDFIAVQGKSLRPREWHFRHHGEKESNCPGGAETALHKLAKQIIVGSSSMTLPKFGVIDYTDPVAEKMHLTTRPDVTVTYKDGVAYFEVAVNHFIEPEKEIFFTRGLYRSVEIDLSRLAPDASLPETEHAVLHDPENKHVIFWEPEPVVIIPPAVPAVIIQSARESNWKKLLNFMKENPFIALISLFFIILVIRKILRFIISKLFD